MIFKLAPTTQKLPEYLFYKVQNKTGVTYKMLKTTAPLTKPVCEINVKQGNLIQALKLKFDRDYKGTEKVKQIFELKELHALNNPEVLNVSLPKTGFVKTKDADAAAQFIAVLGDKKSKPVIINDLDYDPYFIQSLIKTGVMDIRTNSASKKAEIKMAKNELLKAFDNLFDRNIDICDSITDIVDNIIYFCQKLVRKEPITKITSNQTLRNKLDKIQNNDYKLRMLHNDLSNLVYNPAKK